MAAFIDLPPEMRNSIYGLLLTGSTPDLNVLATSRLLHEEASSYYYQNNVFAIDLPCVERMSDRLLPTIPNPSLRYLRYLTINLCLSTSMALQIDSARYIDALADSCPTLISVTINLTSNLSRLLSARVDDMVLSKSHPLTVAIQHLLSSTTIQSVRIDLGGVWFAPHLATRLTSQFEGRLEIHTSKSSPERALLDYTTHTHLHDFGLDTKEAEIVYSLPFAAPSTPASLSSALSELDHFSLTEFLDKEFKDEPWEVKSEKVDSVFNDPDFDMQDELDGIEEELTEEDDVADEEMENIDDLSAILENLGDAMQRAASEADVCYMTNFAPEMLGRQIEGLW